jgi:hypothetical protein
VTVVQRFGSAMQLMPHFHTVGFDGVLSVPKGASLRCLQQVAEGLGMKLSELVAKAEGLVGRR